MVSIDEAQKIIKEKFFKTDQERGIHLTFIWLVEEIGELAEAIKEMNRNMLEEELADVLAWLMSLANLLGINLENAFIKKYL